MLGNTKIECKHKLVMHMDTSTVELGINEGAKVGDIIIRT